MPEMEMEKKNCDPSQCAVERRESAWSCIITVTPSKDDVSGPLLELSEAGRLVLLSPGQASLVSALSNPGGLQ